MSTAPCKLAVEIAEAIYNEPLRNESVEMAITRIAALIDAKIRPLVEDRARMDWLETQRSIILGHTIGTAETPGDCVGIKVGLPSVAKSYRAAIDQARAQRPALEGGDKT